MDYGFVYLGNPYECVSIEVSSTKFHLFEDRFNTDLLRELRQLYEGSFGIEREKSAIREYQNRCETLLSHLCAQASIADDKKLSGVMVTYRLARKLIVSSHIDLCGILTDALQAKTKQEFA